MTKKDFVLIANVLKVCKNTFEDSMKNHDIEDREYALSKGASEATSMIAEALAESLKRTNPLFDTQRFLTACGVELK